MKSISLVCLLGLCSAVYAQSSPTLRWQLDKTPPGIAKLKLYKDLSIYYEGKQVDSAVYFISEGLKLAELLNNTRERALLMLRLGTINEREGNTDVAGKLVSEGLAILRKAGDKEGIAIAYAEMGLIEGKKSHRKEAEEDFDKAMQFFTLSHDTARIVQTLSDLGSIYKNKGDINHALDYYLQALNQYGARPPATIIYLNLLDQIGRLYILTGDAKEALRYLQEGIRRNEDADLRDTETQLLDDEGMAYEKLNQKKKALDLYKLELKKAGEGQSLFDRARALVSIAGILKMQNAKASLADLQEALEIAIRLEDKHLAATIYKAIAGVYSQEKNYHEAMLALDEHHRLLDSLFGTDKAKEMAALDRSYELVETNEEIRDLQVSNKQKGQEVIISLVVIVAILVFFGLFYFYLRNIRKLYKALENSNIVKDRLFSVLGHDLRGPVSSAAQLADMLENGEIEPSDQKELLGALRKQSLATLETLESVLEWGKVQLKGVRVKPNRFEARTIIDKNIGLLDRQAHAKGVNFVNDVPETFIVLTDPDHFNLVVRNLLSNAIKFSHPKGIVSINATEEDSKVIFSVRDQGVGIAKEKLKQFENFGMASSFGTKGEKGTGLGLLLVKEYLEAEGGRIWAESEPEKGTIFYFTIRLG